MRYTRNSRKHAVNPNLKVIKVLFFLCMSALATAPVQASDFETIGGTTPSVDMQAISNQYLTSDGVTFSLRKPKTNTKSSPPFVYENDPRIAKVGSRMTAFVGPSRPWPNLGSPSTSHDMPASSGAATVGTSFLTDGVDLSATVSHVLFIKYDSPVGKATGYLIDTDGPEAWRVDAYSSDNPADGDQPVASYVLCGSDYSGGVTCDKTTSEDGEVDQWVVQAECPTLIRSIAISYIADPAGSRKVGLGFDKFTADAGECAPPDLTINKTAIGALPWQSGGSGEYQYQIVVTNTGGEISSNSTIIVKDDGNFPSPPLNLMNITGEVGWDCISTPGQCSYTVPLGSSIPAGSSWTFSVKVSIDSN